MIYIAHLPIIIFILNKQNLQNVLMYYAIN